MNSAHGVDRRPEVVLLRALPIFKDKASVGVDHRLYEILCPSWLKPVDNQERVTFAKLSK